MHKMVRLGKDVRLGEVANHSLCALVKKIWIWGSRSFGRQLVGERTMVVKVGLLSYYHNSTKRLALLWF